MQIHHLIVVLIILHKIRLTVEIRWITRPRSIDVCEGRTENMIWDFDNEGKNISQLEWYFNSETLIALSTNKELFKAEFPYQNRVKRFGESGIQLKNISREDEGTYTLYPVIELSTSHSMQSISVRVLEPPTDECKVTIKRQLSTLTCTYITTGCGRSQLSLVWKSSRTKLVLAEGSTLSLDSSFSDKEVLCCLNGSAIACYAGSNETFCQSFIVSGDKESSSEGLKFINTNEDILRTIGILNLVVSLIILTVVIPWKKVTRVKRQISKSCGGDRKNRREMAVQRDLQRYHPTPTDCSV